MRAIIRAAPPRRPLVEEEHVSNLHEVRLALQVTSLVLNSVEFALALDSYALPLFSIPGALLSFDRDLSFRFCEHVCENSRLDIRLAGDLLRFRVYRSLRRYLAQLDAEMTGFAWFSVVLKTTEDLLCITALSWFLLLGGGMIALQVGWSTVLNDPITPSVWG